MEAILEGEVDFPRVVTDQMRDVAIVVNTDQEIVYVNQRLTEILPGASGVIGTNAVTAIDALSEDSAVAEQYAIALTEVLDGADERCVTIPVSLPSEEMVLDVRITPYRHNGTCVGAVIIARDITEREQLKDQLLYLNQLLRHDIRNDLNVAQGYAELIADDLPDHQEELENIVSASQHGIELTKAARDFLACVTDEGPASELEPIKITQVITSEVEQIQLLYPEAEVRFTGEDSAVAVQANELLSSAIRNLLTNAIQHNDDPDPTVEISLEESAESVELSVADNGPGIPDEQKSAMFNRGEKGAGSTGSGVGLYLVDQVVKTYDGDVWITDHDPTGTIVHVTLPKLPPGSQIE